MNGIYGELSEKNAVNMDAMRCRSNHRLPVVVMHGRRVERSSSDHDQHRHLRRRTIIITEIEIAFGFC
jgi:hypothetical protein